MNHNTTNEDPAAIEQDIRRTQEDMSRTVDRIGDQLTMRNVFNALLDKADENNVDARMLVDGARRNPMALGLIAAGAIWLVSDKDSKFPSMPKSKRRSSGSSDDFDHWDQDIHHRDYVAHMSSFELRDGEDQESYLRRRDMHRANFLMCEQNPGEDDHSFRQRLNEMTDKFREKRRGWMDSTSQAGSAGMQRTQQLARQASGRTQDMFESNPLVGGILAAALGAALGSAIPVSRKEQEKLGDLGEKARDMASEKKDQLASQAREKKDDLLEKADQKLQQSTSQQGSSQSGTPEFSGAEQSGRGGSQFGDQPQQQDKPFIIGDPQR